MVFTKRLREGIRRGEITCSVRFWMGPRVRVGGRYPMEEGEIEVDSIEPIGFPDITPELARGVGIPGRAGPVEGSEAREGREDLFGAVPLCKERRKAEGRKAEEVEEFKVEELKIARPKKKDLTQRARRGEAQSSQRGAEKSRLEEDEKSV